MPVMPNAVLEKLEREREGERDRERERNKQYKPRMLMPFGINLNRSFDKSKILWELKFQKKGGAL